ncbi:MAG: radical SAM protein, partial [bacterium]|nr:radical SAM protein [bacterium]
YYYKKGVTNFAAIDDCFNLNKENSAELFRLIVKNKLKLQFFFPNGLRGDIMTPGYIDLMAEAGCRGINLSLETASPRLQKLLKKNLDLDKFKNVVDYIAGQHPEIMLEMATMHGFPSETEEEAQMTLDFIKEIKWIHFPYIHILKIFPNTEMEEFALSQGVSKEDIIASRNRAFHELPETLPFPKSFTRKYQADFLNSYFLNKERLEKVLPVQMNILDESALAQKYNAYLPAEIKSIPDLIEFAGLEKVKIPAGYGQKKQEGTNVLSVFSRPPKAPTPESGAKRILILDLSQHFSTHDMLYKVSEQPLGALYLLTHLK